MAPANGDAAIRTHVGIYPKIGLTPVAAPTYARSCGTGSTCRWSRSRCSTAASPPFAGSVPIRGCGAGRASRSSMRDCGSHSHRADSRVPASDSPLDDIVIVPLALRYAGRQIPRRVLLTAWPGGFGRPDVCARAHGPSGLFTCVAYLPSAWFRASGPRSASWGARTGGSTSKSSPQHLGGTAPGPRSAAAGVLPQPATAGAAGQDHGRIPRLRPLEPVVETTSSSQTAP